MQLFIQYIFFFQWFCILNVKWYKWMNAQSKSMQKIKVNNNIVFTLASILGLLFVSVNLHNATVQLYEACSNCVSRSMLTQHHSQSAWPQTGRVHMDKGSSHSVSAAASRCLSRVGSPFGWPPWTISSLCTPFQSRPLMTQSETHKHPFLN